MRYVNVVGSGDQARRVLIVTNPQDPRYAGCVLSYVRLDAADGPCDGGSFYDDMTADEVMALFNTEYGFDPAGWVEVADQLPGGCDDWLAPVRWAGPGQWERFTDCNWLPFKPDTEGD